MTLLNDKHPGKVEFINFAGQLPTDLHRLTELPRLRSLYRQVGSPLPDLREFPRLESVYDINIDVVSLNGLENFPNVRTVVSTAHDYSALARVQSVRKVVIKPFDAESIRHLTHHEYHAVSLGLSELDARTVDLSDLQVKHLTVYDCDGLRLDRLPAELTSFQIMQANDIDFGPLTRLTSLRTLDINKCDSYVNLAAVAGMTSITHIKGDVDVWKTLHLQMPHLPWNNVNGFRSDEDSEAWAEYARMSLEQRQEFAAQQLRKPGLLNRLFRRN